MTSQSTDRGRGTANDPLVIRHLEFLGGMAKSGGWRPPAGLPEIAFSGRSNVGKSSLLNMLLRRKAFARVSKTPGRTREINFFGVNRAFVLADLPGYGYARISKERQGEWVHLIGGYLRENPNLRGVVQLLDARHDPTDDDMRMFDLLAEIGVPALVVVTKIDKLSAKQRGEQIRALALRCGVEEDQIIPCSAQTGEGRDDLAASLAALLEQAAEEAATDAAAAEPVEPSDPDA